MAGEEQRADRGVPSSEPQSETGLGRKAERGLETHHHHGRSTTDEGRFAEEDDRTHGHGEVVAGAREILLRG